MDQSSADNKEVAGANIMDNDKDGKDTVVIEDYHEDEDCDSCVDDNTKGSDEEVLADKDILQDSAGDRADANTNESALDHLISLDVTDTSFTLLPFLKWKSRLMVLLGELKHLKERDVVNSNKIKELMKMKHTPQQNPMHSFSRPNATDQAQTIKLQERVASLTYERDNAVAQQQQAEAQLQGKREYVDELKLAQYELEESIKEKSRQITFLNSQIMSHTALTESLEKNFHTIKEQVMSVEKKFAVERKTVMELKKFNQTLHQKYLSYEADFREVNEKYGIQVNKRQVLEAQMLHLNEQLKLQECEMARQAALLRTEQDKVAGLRLRQTELQDERKIFLAAVEQAQAASREYNPTLVKYEQHTVELKQVVEQLKQELQAEKSNSCQREQGMKDELLKNTALITELQATNLKQKQTAEGIIHDTQRTLAAVQERAKFLENLCNEHREREQAVVTTNLQLRSQVQECKLKEASLECELQKEKDQTALVERKSEELQKEVAGLKEKQQPPEVQDKAGTDAGKDLIENPSRGNDALIPYNPASLPSKDFAAVTQSLLITPKGPTKKLPMPVPPQVIEDGDDRDGGDDGTVPNSIPQVSAPVAKHSQFSFSVDEPEDHDVIDLSELVFDVDVSNYRKPTFSLAAQAAAIPQTKQHGNADNTPSLRQPTNNQSKDTSSSNSANAQCTCGRNAFGMMVECISCRHQFHAQCLPAGTMNAGLYVCDQCTAKTTPKKKLLRKRKNADVSSPKQDIGKRAYVNNNSK